MPRRYKDVYEQRLEQYEERNRSRRLAETTMVDYGYTLRMFHHMLKEAKLTTHPDDIAEREVNFFIDTRRPQVGEKYLQTQYRQIKGFLEWNENWVMERMGIRWNAPPRINVYWLEQEESEALVEVATSPLDQLLLHLGMELGLRSVDARWLKVGYFNHSAKILQVYGKGQKWRNIPYHPMTETILDQWMVERAELIRKAREKGWNGPEPDDLIIMYQGRWGVTAPSKTGLHKHIISLFHAAGIPKLKGKAGFHTLRRTFGRNMYFALLNSPSEWSRAPLDIVRELLGHSKAETTILYLGLNTGDMKSAMAYAPNYRRGTKTAIFHPEITQPVG